MKSGFWIIFVLTVYSVSITAAFSFSLWMNSNPIKHHYSTENDNVKVGFMQDGLSKRIKLSFCNMSMLSFHIPADFWSVVSLGCHTHNHISPPHAICHSTALKTAVLTVFSAVTLLHFVKNTKTQIWRSPMFSPHAVLVETEQALFLF